MPKNVILCCDGTWNHPASLTKVSECDTNVYKLYRSSLATATQIRHYDDGVGSDGTPIDHLLGGAIGAGLFKKVKSGYTFIAQTYLPGDNVFLFGFSRGAYTARSVAGMIATCGLPAQSTVTDQLIDMAFQAYRDVKNRATLLAQLQAQNWIANPTIKMVGVWDTVGALGIPGALFAGLNEQQYGFLNTTLSAVIQSAYQAVSVDERRAEFGPTLWQRSPQAPETQVMEQVWFAGVHCDVGGGYNETGLSDIALAWMMTKAAGQGVVFDPDAFNKYINVDPKHALDVAHQSWSPLWGFPQWRSVPATACIANSVGIRIQHDPGGYKPANLNITPGSPLGAYAVVQVVAEPSGAAAAGASTGS
jgi:uncharacterized protein (DUF2235 family)